MTKRKSWMDHARSLDADWPPRQPMTIADLVAEARTVEQPGKHAAELVGLAPEVIMNGGLPTLVAMQQEPGRYR